MKAKELKGPSEDQIHRAVAQWVRLHEARYTCLKLMFHPANGGKRSRGVAGTMRAMLVRPGVPDLMLPWPDMKGHRGLAIELKSRDGVVRASQTDFMAMLRLAGWMTEVCRSVDHALAVIGWYVGTTSAYRPVTTEAKKTPTEVGAKKLTSAQIMRLAARRIPSARSRVSRRI